MDIITAATISPIPTLSDFTASGGKPEEYNAYVERRTAELEAEAFRAAGALAKKTVRVRVVGNGWRPGQTQYRVLAKAPFDPRLQPGQPGYESPYKHEPPLSLRIGAVTLVPIRDERHLAVLKTDVNLKFEDDGVPTHEEEKALVDAARKQVLDGTMGVSTTPVADPSKHPEIIRKTDSVGQLLAWLGEADKRGDRTTARAVEDRLGALSDDVSDAMEARATPEDRELALTTRGREMAAIRKAEADARKDAESALDRAAKSAQETEVAKRQVAELQAELDATRKQVEELTKPPAPPAAVVPAQVKVDQQGQQPKKK